MDESNPFQNLNVLSQPSAPQATAAPTAGGAARPIPVGSAAAQKLQASRPVPVGAAPIPADRSLPTTFVPRQADPEEEVNPELDSILKNSPPWLVSMIVHMVMLIVLGLWIFSVHREPRVELLVYAEELGEQLDEETFELTADDETDLKEQIITPDNLPEVEDPLAAPPDIAVNFAGDTAISTIDAPAIGLALTGRTKGMKQALLAAYGGNATTEAAVTRGLEWLVRQQKRDGSWSLKGPYSKGAINENHQAATAMALLAFQGAGYTHEGDKRNPFNRAVKKGWDWLIKQQDADGNFFHEGVAHHRFYTQAQCTIALCELYGMTKDKRFKDAARKAVEYCVKTQDTAGGWRYYPGGGSDTSVTGWFVMALQSARMSGIEVPYGTFDRISAFLDSVSVDEGRRYGYLSKNDPRISMTAEGLLCRQYLGWARDDARLVDGTDLLVRNPMDWGDRNAYYWYYAAQVCHHMEGPQWKAWNSIMRQLLPEKQIMAGDERGSWDPDGDQWGGHGGRLMVTCLHIYMLEVYYRHLPIYQHKAIASGSAVAP